GGAGGLGGRVGGAPDRGAPPARPPLPPAPAARRRATPSKTPSERGRRPRCSSLAPDLRLCSRSAPTPPSHSDLRGYCTPADYRRATDFLIPPPPPHPINPTPTSPRPP